MNIRSAKGLALAGVCILNNQIHGVQCYQLWLTSTTPQPVQNQTVGIGFHSLQELIHCVGLNRDQALLYPLGNEPDLNTGPISHASFWYRCCSQLGLWHLIVRQWKDLRWAELVSGQQGCFTFQGGGFLKAEEVRLARSSSFFYWNTCLMCRKFNTFLTCPRQSPRVELANAESFRKEVWAILTDLSFL